MKNNSRTDWRRLLNLSMRVVVALVMVGLLVIPVAVQADLKITAVVSAWDEVAGLWQNSNIVIPWAEYEVWIPFMHQLNFDTGLWANPLACTAATPWAGDMYYGLYHIDNAPAGAPGFQESRNWSLISCDRNGDGKYGPADDRIPPKPYDQMVADGEILAMCDVGGTNCITVTQDQPVECTTGNCAWEIVTTIQVNLDVNASGVCDGTVEPQFDPDLTCFYAEARVPNADEVAAGGLWSTPLQARISASLAASAGDKTVTFNNVPTAVELASFDAAVQGNGVLLNWETANEIDNVGFNVYRAEAQSGQLIKINPYLIASQNPGSTAGAAYSFLDDSAMPGATYYYWLEDVDASGIATRQGPVEAKMGAVRALPGRQRPAPMPRHAF